MAEIQAQQAGQGPTAARILDVVEALMMERGFNAISYQDVSERIGIRKASVHYHFPAKADLGAAVIQRYAAKLAAVTPPIESLRSEDLAPAFETFLAMFALVAASPGKVCLGGVLGAEFMTLPESMQREVQGFYAHVEDWLSALLGRGKADGVFSFEGESRDVARLIFAAHEGALLIGRATGDGAVLAATTRLARGIVGFR